MRILLACLGLAFLISITGAVLQNRREAEQARHWIDAVEHPRPIVAETTALLMITNPETPEKRISILADGSVVIEGFTVDEAASEFWAAVTGALPGVREGLCQMPDEKGRGSQGR